MIKKCILFCLLCVYLNACSGIDIEEPQPYVTEQGDRIRQQNGTIHGNQEGFVLYSTRLEETTGSRETTDDTNNGDPVASIDPTGTVNPYLWQASLESLDFMPLAQADLSGGVIITDWYAPQETPEERFKVTVYILDPALRADAFKVTVFRQIDSVKGWVDASVDKGTAVGLEENILTRARELRLTTTGVRSTS